MADVKVLLEVMFERHIDERCPGGSEFHARTETALDHGDVTGREVLIEVRHEAAHADPISSGQRRGIDPRTRDDEELQLGSQRAGDRHRVEHPTEQRLADRGATDRDDTQSVVCGSGRYTGRILRAEVWQEVALRATMKLQPNVNVRREASPGEDWPGISLGDPS